MIISIIDIILYTSIDSDINYAYGIIEVKIKSLYTAITSYIQRIYRSIRNENWFSFTMLCMHSILQLLKGIILTSKVSHHSAKHYIRPQLGNFTGA